MQTELEQEELDLDVRFLGINNVGNELNAAVMCEHSILPYLQDVESAHVYRDYDLEGQDYKIRILDENNVIVGQYDFAANSILLPANYYELKGIIEGIAGR
jgi:hypothetical protein